ncbi:LuxR C-terminal-related transcriptional regulator [Streptomyces sp. MK5]|uniref:LuxR C-terminal-related transcriptional regulator n=1 Tax=Streptomyces sp. MK5 TaxID=3064253 RepID=UPI003556FF63
MEGLTNREIAARLFLSARKISTHPYRIHPKVGGSSPTDLAIGDGPRLRHLTQVMDQRRPLWSEHDQQFPGRTSGSAHVANSRAAVRPGRRHRRARAVTRRRCCRRPAARRRVRIRCAPPSKGRPGCCPASWRGTRAS